MEPPITFAVKTYWFSKPVSFKVECVCPVEIARWKFWSPQLLSCKAVPEVVSHMTKTLLVVKETSVHA